MTAVLILLTLVRNRGIMQVNSLSAKNLAGDPQVTILDVRTPQEFEDGHIRNARLIPGAEINDRIAEIVSLKDRPIMVYCRAGSRSSAAAAILKKQGFTKITNLTGGISAWKSQGFEITKD